MEWLEYPCFITVKLCANGIIKKTWSNCIYAPQKSGNSQDGHIHPHNIHIVATLCCNNRLRGSCCKIVKIAAVCKILSCSDGCCPADSVNVCDVLWQKWQSVHHQLLMVIFHLTEVSRLTRQHYKCHCDIPHYVWSFNLTVFRDSVCHSFFCSDYTAVHVAWLIVWYWTVSCDIVLDLTHCHACEWVGKESTHIDSINNIPFIGFRT